MPHDPTELAALIGSRICHDLVSPIGAIGNGVELLAMAGAAGPEVRLIAESVAAANARIRFFRIAFGAATPGQRVALPEIRLLLDDLTRGGRLSFDWQVPGDQPRGIVKLAFLVLQCCETALPFGGRVTIAAAEGAWQILAEADKLKIDDALWARLAGSGGQAEGTVAPAQVQFALAPTEAAALGRALQVTRAPGRVEIRF